MSNPEIEKTIKKYVQLAIERGLTESKNGRGWGDDDPENLQENSGIGGVSIPINVPTPKGKLRCYVTLPADVLTSRKTFLNALLGLMEMKLPLDFYRDKKDWDKDRDNGSNRGGW